MGGVGFLSVAWGVVSGLSAGLGLWLLVSRVGCCSGLRIGWLDLIVAVVFGGLGFVALGCACS